MIVFNIMMININHQKHRHHNDKHVQYAVTNIITITCRWYICSMFIEHQLIVESTKLLDDFVPLVAFMLNQNYS